MPNANSQMAKFSIQHRLQLVWETTSCLCCAQQKHSYVAESASDFMREVYVHTNQQNEPITLSIEGSAVEQCGKYY